jgi:hypothetical protein
MSFTVALQSAVFYFAACTPCAKVRHRQKARQKAKREREDKARLEAEMPHLYRHPSPFTTNPYWSEEIEIGPSLPKKKGKNSSQQALAGAAKANSRAGSAVAVSSTGGTIAQTSPRIQPADITGIEEMPTLSVAASMSTADEGWNTKRYQREEEELWGHELSKTGHKLMDAIKQAGSSAGRFMEAKLGMDKAASEEERSGFYLTPRNPPVNDYHPPVVSSKPARQDGHRWMLQPPPPAKFMEGKIPVSRTASQTSVVSRRTVGTEGSALGKRVSARLLETKIRESAEPVDPDHLSAAYLTRPHTRRTMTSSTTGGRSQRSVRSRSHSMSTESEGSDAASRRRRRLHQKQSSALELDSDEDEVQPQATKTGASGTVTPAHSLKRPKLQTIASSESGTVLSRASTRERLETCRQPASGATEATGPVETVLAAPLADKTNSPPPTDTDRDQKARPTGTSIDSGLAMQD